MASEIVIPIACAALIVIGKLEVILLLLVGGAKVGQKMKKRKNFFQVFSFSFIYQWLRRVVWFGSLW
jgi:hypothetical protein